MSLLLVCLRACSGETTLYSDRIARGYSAGSRRDADSVRPNVCTQTGSLTLEDVFVAKYEAGKQTELAEHEDGSYWSFVLPLNPAVRLATLISRS